MRAIYSCKSLRVCWRSASLGVFPEITCWCRSFQMAIRRKAMKSIKLKFCFKRERTTWRYVNSWSRHGDSAQLLLFGFHSSVCSSPLLTSTSCFQLTSSLWRCLLPHSRVTFCWSWCMQPPLAAIYVKCKVKKNKRSVKNNQHIYWASAETPLSWPPCTILCLLLFGLLFT